MKQFLSILAKVLISFLLPLLSRVGTLEEVELEEQAELWSVKYKFLRSNKVKEVIIVTKKQREYWKTVAAKKAAEAEEDRSSAENTTKVSEATKDDDE